MDESGSRLCSGCGLRPPRAIGGGTKCGRCLYVSGARNKGSTVCPACGKTRYFRAKFPACKDCRGAMLVAASICKDCGGRSGVPMKHGRCRPCYSRWRKVVRCACGADAQRDRAVCRTCQRKAEATRARERYKSDPEYKAHRRSFRSKWKRASDGTVTAKWMAGLLSNSSKCYYCRKPTLRRDRTVEHVIPLALGGRHSVANIAMACRDCNIRKGARIWTIL